jgi:hypothetical protein
MTQFVKLSDEGEKELVTGLLTKLGEELRLSELNAERMVIATQKRDTQYAHHMWLANAVNAAQLFVFVALFARFVWPMI